MGIQKNERVITKEGKKKLQDELKNLIEIERPRVIQEIKSAREQGDLSENAEFDAAREEQGKIEDRVKEIDSILDNAKIIAQTKKNAEQVMLGSIVTIKDLRTNETKEYKIVGSLEADPFNGLISNESPISQALLNKVKNDEVVVDVDKKYKIKIMNIKSK
jgi:transcription elongation factor GreA